MTHGSGRDPVRDLLDARCREGWMPGAVWVVADATGTISRGCVGQAQIQPVREPLTPSTAFDLASLTKPFGTALLLALFEHQQRLDPLAPVAEYFEALRGSIWEHEPIQRFAIHATGLPAWRPLFLQAHDLNGYLHQIARLERMTQTEQIQYSDLGYIVLGAMLEAIGGAPLDVLFEKYVARPWGLKSIGFVRAPSCRADAAPTERGNAFERTLAAPLGSDFDWRSNVIRGQVHDANAWGLGGVAGHAGLFGTLDDVATLASSMLLTEGPLAALIRQRLFHPVGESGRTAGMVIASHSQAARGVFADDAPGHTGFTGTSVWFEPKKGRAYVLLTHRVHPVVPQRNFQQLRAEFHRTARDFADSSRSD